MRHFRRTGSADRAQAHFQAGLAAYRAGSLEAAIGEFTAAIGLDREHAPAHYQRGMAYARSGDLTRASDDFRWVVDRSGEPRLIGDALYSLGLAAEKSGDLKAAVGHYARAVQCLPNPEKALCNRGAVLTRLERFDEALRDLSAALELDPNDALAYWNRALVSHALGKADAVRGDLEQFLRLAPPGHPYRARAERMLETEPRARSAVLDRAAQKEAARLAKRVIQLNNEGSYEEAAALCDRLLELDDSREIAWDEKAFALMALDRWEEAEAACERGLAAVPDAVRLHFTRGTLLERRERHREAVAAYRKYAEVAPPEYGENVAKALARARQLEAQLGGRG